MRHILGERKKTGNRCLQLPVFFWVGLFFTVNSS